MFKVCRIENPAMHTPMELCTVGFAIILSLLDSQSLETMHRWIYNPAELCTAGFAILRSHSQKTKHKKRGFDESPSVYFAAAYAVNFFFSRIRADLPVRSRK